MMLNSLSSHSNSTELEKIEDLDFSQIYDSISKVYDFFDDTFWDCGDIEETQNILKEKFENYIIYENTFIKISIYILSIENEKISASLKVDTNYRPAVKFGQEYLEWQFIERKGLPYDEHFNFIHTKFNVIEIKTEIKKRLNIIRQRLNFEKKWYYFLFPSYRIPYLTEKALYKKFNIKKDKNFRSFSIVEKNFLYEQKIYTYFHLLMNNLKEIWNITQKFIGLFELEINWDVFDICIYESENILINIYIWAKNMPLDKIENVYNLVSKYIEKIDNILEEKKRLSKIVRKNKKRLYNVLIGKFSNEINIRQNLEEILLEYKKLQEIWEILYSPKVIDLLEDMLQALDGVYDIRISDYIVQEFNSILQYISQESESNLIQYYKKVLIYFLEKKSNHLDKFKNLIYKIDKFSESDCIKVLWDSLININSDYMDIIIEIMGLSRPRFIASIYKTNMKYDINDNQNIDINKYKNLSDYIPYLSDDDMELYENIIVCVGAQYMVKYPNYINNLDGLIKDYKLEKFIEDISMSEVKYSAKVYNKVYEYCIAKDKELIGKQEIDISVYYSIDSKNIDKKNIDVFCNNILLPYIIYKLHIEKDKKIVDKCIHNLQKWYLTRTIRLLECDDKLIYNNFYKFPPLEYCNQILKYWYVIANKNKLSDYTKKWLDIILEENYNKDLFFDKDFLESLMVDEIKAIAFLETHSNFPKEIWVRLAGHSSVEVRKKLALFWPKLAVEVQKVLAEDKEEEVVLNLLQLWLSDKADMLIAKHPSVEVRKKLALFWPKLAVEVQKVLAEDKDEEVSFIIENLI